MKKILSILILAAISFSVTANDGNKNEKLKMFTITGKVTDNHEGLTGVQVFVDGEPTNVFTDFDGNFTLENVLEGAHTVSFDMIAYENKAVQINTNNTNSIVVEMSDR